ncbi:MAG: DUF4265 domain-containing protein [Roseateles sp.]|uniref:DUF4265 domain-containing protein n=1 Tax=Roseateles sp. TaxID=1971397 RepID=UPI0039E958B9
MNDAASGTVSLKFRLDVEDDWPPVALESLPFRKVVSGYETLAAPLFVKDLSVGDVIEAKIDGKSEVESWRHVSRSDHTTVWLLRLKQPNQIEEVLAKLRELGCNSVGLDAAGCYAIDVPPTVGIGEVDAVLARLDDAAVATAFPSMRHPE